MAKEKPEAYVSARFREARAESIKNDKAGEGGAQGQGKRPKSEQTSDDASEMERFLLQTIDADYRRMRTRIEALAESVLNENAREAQRRAEKRDKSPS